MLKVDGGGARGCNTAVLNGSVIIWLREERALAVTSHKQLATGIGS